jgi:phage terminase Nu1 subunit (DNA packaging protein)
MNTVPEGLPPTLTTAQMRFLTGLSIGRLDQLAQSGVINRLSKGVYASDSVARYIRFQRESAAGPKDWRDVRTEIGREKLALLRLERRAREGELLEKTDVINMNVAIMTTVKNRLLAVPVATAPRLMELHRPQEAESVVRDAIVNALEELAGLRVVLAGRNGSARRQRNGNTRIEEDVDEG